MLICNRNTKSKRICFLLFLLSAFQKDVKTILKLVHKCFFSLFVTSPSKTGTVCVPDSDKFSCEGNDSLRSWNLPGVKDLAWDGNLNQMPAVLTAFGIVAFGYRQQEIFLYGLVSK